MKKINIIFGELGVMTCLIGGLIAGLREIINTGGFVPGSPIAWLIGIGAIGNLVFSIYFIHKLSKCLELKTL